MTVIRMPRFATSRTVAALTAFIHAKRDHAARRTSDRAVRRALRNWLR